MLATGTRHITPFLSLSLYSVAALVLCGYWLSKQSVPKDIYHNQYTTAASSCGPWPQPQHSHWRSEEVKGKWSSRSHCCRQWTREYVLVFLYLFISGFPCSFLCLHGSLSKADAEKARARTAHTSHTTCVSLFLPLSFSHSRPFFSATVLLHVAIRA